VSHRWANGRGSAAQAAVAAVSASAWQAVTAAIAAGCLPSRSVRDGTAADHGWRLGLWTAHARRVRMVAGAPRQGLRGRLIVMAARSGNTWTTC
jgi:hypothetical protein